MGSETRSILKKIKRNASLDGDEYRRLADYYENLRHSSPESYALFYREYSEILFRGYNIYLPRFTVDMDDILHLLADNQQLRSSLAGDLIAIDLIPQEYRQFMTEILEQPDSRRLLLRLIQNFGQPQPGDNVLPRPRVQAPVYIYEKSNPYKEIGLKGHFERLGRFSFITRLQSYRYLSHKASQDRIQYLYPDCLGGIFSNKEKSIYYYVFLSESDQGKAENAARLLNLALYGEDGGA